MNAKLTAYALNELPPDERAALEAEMESNPALRAEAEEMRKFCTLVHDELAEEDRTALTTDQRVRVLREFSADSQPRKPERSIWRHPAFLVPTAIAACTTVMLVINLRDKHVSQMEEAEQLTDARLTERTRGRASSENVRVTLEKTEKAVATTSQTPAPGKPEIASLVADNAPTVVSGPASARPPMPTSGTPAAPALLLPPSLDGSMPAILTAEPAGKSKGSDGALAVNGSATFSTPGAPQTTMRGIGIGAARPLERFNFTPATPDNAFADATPATPADASGLLEGMQLTPEVANAPLHLVTDDASRMTSSDPLLAFGAKLNESSLNAVPAPGDPLLPGNNTYTGGVTVRGGTLVPENNVTEITLSGGASAPPLVTGQSGSVMFGKEAPSTGGLTKNGDSGWAQAGTGGGVARPSSGEAITTFAGVVDSSRMDFTLNDNTTIESQPKMERADALTELNRSSASAGNQNTTALGIEGSGTREPLAAGVPMAPQPDAVGAVVTPAPIVATATPQRAAEPAPARPEDSMALAVNKNMDGLAGTAIPAEAPAAAAKPAAPPAPMATIAPTPAAAAAPASPPADPYIAQQIQSRKRVTVTESRTRTAREMERVDAPAKDLRQIKDLQDDDALGRRLITRDPNGETYTPIYENPFLQVAQQPLSTFSIDVDTASYANVRRFLNNGQRPPADAVRLEELINYFPYSYEPPAEDGAPFSVTVDMAEAPWQPMHRLARIALKGREIHQDRGPANFVFLVDVSGSMNQPDKLPLVKQSLRMLTEQLKDTDRVAIVTYAGKSGVALTSTPGSERKKIQGAIDELSAGGSTNGAGGIRTAYQQATQNFIQKGVNRVILCTDGDFNVGISSPEELEKLIAEKAKSRVFLSVLGYGTGNLKDRTMETLADKGNGNYAYIDSLSEARKVLVDQMHATLVTIAKDVKIQVEFNPAQIASYRLLGYENRALAKEDFNNDRKDAGEIGAGHTVTALYEIVPVGASMTTPDGRPMVDELKYAPKPALGTETASATPAMPGGGSPSKETMTVKLRYKQPEGDKSELIEVPVTDMGQTMGDAPQDFVFAAGVTGFGMMLRNSQYSGELTWDMVRALALRGKGEDPLGYRGEFLQLIDKARGLTEGRE